MATTMDCDLGLSRRREVQREFRGVLPQLIPASGEPLDGLINHPPVDAAPQLLTGRGTGQSLEPQTGPIQRAHAQQNLEARIGGSRTQGRMGCASSSNESDASAALTCAAKLTLARFATGCCSLA
jgi:hypothetical protein